MAALLATKSTPVDDKPVAYTQLVPFNIEAEQAVLGSIILDPASLMHVMEFLKPDFFYRETHRWIYQAMLKLYSVQTPIDFQTLRDELDVMRRLDAISGDSYLIHLVTTTLTSAHIVHYARLVERDAIRRAAVSVGSQVSTLGHNETDPDAIISKAQQLVMGLARQTEKAGLRPVGYGVTKLSERMDQGKPPGHPTGFYDLDKLTGGLKPGRLYVIGARTGIGKSVLMANIAANWAEAGKRVAFFSLEMSDEEIVARMIAAKSILDHQRIEEDLLSEREYVEFYRWMGEIERWPLMISYSPGITPLQLRTRIQHELFSGSFDLVVVDYLQRMKGDGRPENRTQEVGSIARSLKDLAIELKTPVLTASQISRAAETTGDRKPTLAYLRESGDIEQEADCVWLLHRDNREALEADLEVAKHRSGPTGLVKLVFDGSHMCFRNAQRGY